MRKHTPGPWMATIEKCDIEGVSCRYTIDSDREIRIAYGQAQEHVGGIDGDTIRANASLIAAAPDMLAAIQCMLKDFGTGFDGMPSVGMCRAAVAKATGGES